MIVALYPAHLCSQAKDGRHDFDFFLGAWKVHLQRLAQPLVGSHYWIDFEGTSVTRKIWGGRANLGGRDRSHDFDLVES
jgi:hypothetical protein